MQKESIKDVEHLETAHRKDHQIERRDGPEDNHV